MGGHGKTAVLLSWIIEAAAVPLVIDADGLNMLARNIAALKKLKAPAVLTPHPGEMARLTGLPAQAVQADRISCARKLAGQYKVIVVLKGSRTVIAAPTAAPMSTPPAIPAWQAAAWATR